MEKKYYDGANETVYHYLLENGLNVYLIKKEGFTSTSACFATNFGSINSGDYLIKDKNKIAIIPGLAHFLEHRVFDYKKGNIIDLFYELGADVNAYTTYDKTVYYFTCNSNFYECLELLLDFPTSFTMTKEKVENEKEIIIRELMMGKDRVENKLYMSLLNSLYPNHSVKYEIVGEKEDINNTSIELLKDVHNYFYSPKNMSLVVVGNMDVDKTIELVKNKKFNNSKMELVKKKIENNLDIEYRKNEISLNINNNKILIGYKLKDYSLNENKIKDEVCINLYLNMLFSKTSDFYKYLIDKKIVSSFNSDFLSLKNMFCLFFEADLLVDEEIFLEVLNNYINDSISLLDEIKLKESKKIEIAHIIEISDSVKSLAKYYISNIVEGYDFFEFIDIIKSISLSDIISFYNNYIKGSKYHLSIIRKRENNE